MLNYLKKKIAVIGLCFLALSFSGCTQKRYLSHQVNIDDFQRDSLSILITKIRSRERGVALTLIRLDEHYNDPQLRTAYRLTRSYSQEHSVLMVKPGIYAVERIEWDDTDYAYSSASPALFDNVVCYGAFEVKPGQIAYVGDFEVDFLPPNKLDAFVVDAMEEARRAVAKKYSHWTERIEKIPFFGAGTRIEKDGSGRFTIFS